MNYSLFVVWNRPIIINCSHSSKTVNEKNILNELFKSWCGSDATTITTIPQSGSYRQYFRLSGNGQTAIGVSNEDVKENNAFLTFTKHFNNLKLPVPEIYIEHPGKKQYLLSDLGDLSLFDFLIARRKQVSVFPGSAIQVYKQTLEELPEFQIEASRGLDYSACYPRAAFDRQSMMWDLSYFKYYFLKLAKIPFDEQLLEDEFSRFSKFLLQADAKYFLYRDFQSKNIMLLQNKPYFIDYQGGRKGALQYDVASLLYDSKANIPFEIKDLLLDHYLNHLSRYIKFDRSTWLTYYRGFVLVRLMQAMGAYGFRGFYERRTQFLKNIPYALIQLEGIFRTNSFPAGFPYLEKVLGSLTTAKELLKYRHDLENLVPLNIEITSFSYHKGLPENKHGHGGGFIFDCRGIHNPGGYARFNDKSGLDAEVIDFLKSGGEADTFLNHSVMVVEQTIEKFLNRAFSNLQISFGCTGGQHRSVFCAERLAEMLSEKYEDKINIVLHHRDLPAVKA